VKGFIRQRGDAWELRVFLGNDPLTGKERYTTRSVRCGIREANRILAEMVVDAERGIAPRARATVGELIECDSAVDQRSRCANRCRQARAPQRVDDVERLLGLLGGSRSRCRRPHGSDHRELSHRDDDHVDWAYVVPSPPTLHKSPGVSPLTFDLYIEQGALYSPHMRRALPMSSGRYWCRSGAITYGSSQGNGHRVDWLHGFQSDREWRSHLLLPLLNIENVTAFNNARASRVNPTNVNTAGATQSTADVVVQDANYSSCCGYTWDTNATDEADGVVGLAKCNSIWTGPFSNFCNQHGIYVDTSFTTPKPEYRENLATHEIGHTLGRYHEADCVMRQGYPKPRNGFSLHSTGELNEAFP
jgi:hypothetical protein